MNYDDAEPLGRSWQGPNNQGSGQECPAEGNDDARETLRTQCFGGHAHLKTFFFVHFARAQI